MKQNKDHIFLHTLSTGQIFILQKQIGLQFAQVYLLQKKKDQNVMPLYRLTLLF